MQIELNLHSAKKIVQVLLVSANLFAIGAAFHYTYYRYSSRQFFEVLTFDVNNRMPEIRSRYLALVKAQEAAAAATPTTTSTIPTPTAFKK